jgi:hypothetical protein
MAVISKSIAAAHGLRANLVPADTRAKLSQAQLEDRLAYAADLAARADNCRNSVLASCYQQVAKAALTALPPDEVVQKARNLRAKAAMLGPGSQADTLQRLADDLEAANPVPPRRAVVRKAGDPVSSDNTGLVALYDCNGQLYGVAEGGEIVPALDPDVVCKASSAGMVATHDPETGKVKGFVEPDAIQPVTAGTTGLGKPRKTGPPQSLPPDDPQGQPAGGVPGRQVVKAAYGPPVRTADGRVALLRDLPPRNARRTG